MFVALAVGAGLLSSGYGTYKYLWGVKPSPAVTVSDKPEEVIVIDNIPEAVKTKECLLDELKRKLEGRREGFELVKATLARE